MIDNKDKPSKFYQNKSFWFISLFTFASCLPLVLLKVLNAPSIADRPQTYNAGDRLPALTVANNSETAPKTNNLPHSTRVVPQAPDSIETQASTPTNKARSIEPVAPTKTKSESKPKTEAKTVNKTTTNKTTTASKTKNTPTTQTKTATQTKPKQNKTTAAVSPIIEVSVAIETDVTSLTVGSSTKAAITDEKGRIIHNINANQGLVARVNGNGIQIDNWQLPAVTWIQPQQTGGAVYIGDKWFRGKLLLVADKGKLLAINHVDLEHYLYSVVGSEMHPTANINALKAQAVAARSYALVHIIRPASRWYNLGDTQRWQVYKGVGTEYNTTQRAVNETNNKILSHQGGVVESLYASTDEIVNRVHGGSGMSQTGAYKLAEAGYNYQQILGYYYPGVELATLIRK
jgi:peptidoglycan hydrolase-like amidase